MTAPRADGVDRTSGARRQRGARAAVGSLAVLLLVGLLLRLTIAYVLLPGSGFESDIGTFTAWALRLGHDGPGTFYLNAGFADYPPGYLYVLWLLGGLGGLLAPLTNGDAGAATAALIKLPPMLMDIAVGALLYYIVRSWRANRPDAQRLALTAAALYLLNPVTWYDSAIWGQTDAAGALVILLTVVALMRGNSEGASVLAVVAALVKPQFGVVVLPVVAIVLLRRHLLRPGTNPRHKVLLPERLRTWFEVEDGVWRIVSSAASALVVLLLFLAPFSMDVVRFFNQMTGTASGYPYLSVNAYNVWALLGAGGAQPLAFGGGWSYDLTDKTGQLVPLLGPLPGVVIGGALLALGFLLGVVRLAWRDDRRSVVAVTIFLALAFFMLPTRVHERYMFPIFGLLPLLAVVDRRWMMATVALSIAAFINMHGILTTELYATPNLEHLPFGELFRQPLGVLAAIFLNVFGFVLIAWQLRPGAATRRAALPERAGAPRAPVVSAPVGARSAESPWSTQPATSGDAGLAAATALAPREPDDLEPLDVEPVADDEPPQEPSPVWRWLSALVDWPSVRRDRSALLVTERGGRLDRRDVALLLLVFVGSLLLRTYRLEVPYGPHFDEVYHARTAIEFLQDWRYGMPHSIYEYTHPHLAKYAMALGIIALGNNRVMDTRDLGTAVTDAATEERWSLTGQPDGRNGDRLYVATGGDLRVYDLATRAEVAHLAGAISALALDETAHVLYAADANGVVFATSTTAFDDMRANPVTPAPNLQPFAQASAMIGPIARLAVTGGQLVAVSQGGSLISFDLTGAETGHTTITSANAVVGVQPRAEVLVDPAQVTDAAGYSQTLAGLISGDAARIQTAINAAGATRTIIAGDVGAVIDDIQAAIDDGRLPGTAIESRPLIAVSTTSGISLLDAATLTQIKSYATDEPVGGMALVTGGPDVPTIYAASGAELVTLRLPDDAQAALGSPVPMPNGVENVVWNRATTMIHVLGRTQNGTSPTVYVVEPRSNAVFADASLAFEPQALAMDVQPDRPAEDRDDLLALSSTGQLATIDVGNNQYAYRFPGVLVAALMAACIYLLARFLFARRLVALIVALLVLADGMFFANARIAMNDTYVAFFIVAALTVFVPVWLGRWRSRRAIALGLVAVGVLLGLAFASKWVGLYAMGAVGLMILFRSALGRLIALVAMIGLTALLGYIAITPAASVANPSLNYLFLFLMVALTTLLAVGIYLRPMRFSTEELRLGALAALVPGPIILGYGLFRMFQGGPPPILGTFLTPSRIAMLGAALTFVGVAAVVGVWFAGRRGYGPLAQRTIEEGEAPKEPPAPRGWLRPGSGFLGLPWLLALGAITIIPIVVYAISYIPWIELGNRWTATFPPGNTGQMFLDLQKSMYDYHNNLRATHPASSPWWAWLLDLKPVWFEQNDYAGGTTAVIYDTGNLVAFWLAIPAIGWTCWQAWKRHSLPLAFLAITIASLWLPWARIDRATFQYHIFTTLPFTFMALAYFLAELWHGPSPNTWLLARAGAAIALIGAPLLWLLRQPLCGLANTQAVNANTEVCGALSRHLVLTDVQAVGLVLAIGGLAVAAVLVYLGMRAATAGTPLSSSWSLLLPVCFSVALFGVTIVVLGAGLTGNPVFQADVRAEEPAFVALLLLAVPAYFVLRAADPRKFVVGALAAVVIWFVAFYPNIASLPVPTPLSQIHLGLLPTWNWGFQFAVNLDPANTSPISWSSVGLLAVAVIGLCVAAVYAARSWNAARYASAEVSGLPETS